MRIRSPRELGHLILDGRRRLGWSQSELASVAGVSRQWISMVENGKTSAEFDLVFATLKALGYLLRADWEEIRSGPLVAPGVRVRSTLRTALTRAGKPLGRSRPRKGRDR